jgi:thiamine-phosphate pyrophosphorylase
LLLYYITDRSQFSGDESSRRKKLLEKIAEGAICGVDFIQLREKDLSTRELELLAQKAMQVLGGNNSRRTRLLINSRTDVAVAVGADGIHLRSDDISPKDVREVWRSVGGEAVVSVASHSLSDLESAAKNGADYALFGPVFEKKGQSGQRSTDPPSTGLEFLKQASGRGIPVIALGGVTLENARSCIEAGAVGIAGIRIFQENHIMSVVNRLKHVTV